MFFPPRRRNTNLYICVRYSGSGEPWNMDRDGRIVPRGVALQEQNSFFFVFLFDSWNSCKYPSGPVRFLPSGSWSSDTAIRIQMSAEGINLFHCRVWTRTYRRIPQVRLTIDFYDSHSLLPFWIFHRFVIFKTLLFNIYIYKSLDGLTLRLTLFYHVIVII